MNKNIVKINLDALNFTISDSLYSRDLNDTVFTIARNVGEEWIIYLSKNKKGYYKELVNYYNNQIKEIMNKSNQKLDVFLQEIKKETDNKIKEYDRIKEIIHGVKKRGWYK